MLKLDILFAANDLAVLFLMALKEFIAPKEQGFLGFWDSSKLQAISRSFTAQVLAPLVKDVLSRKYLDYNSVMLVFIDNENRINYHRYLFEYM